MTAPSPLALAIYRAANPARLVSTAGPIAVPVFLPCDTCGDEIREGEAVTLGGQVLCPEDAMTDASHVLSAWLRPEWSPTPGAVRDAQEALGALSPLLLRVMSRVQREAGKVASEAPPLCARCHKRAAIKDDTVCRVCIEGLREDAEEARAEARREARMNGEGRP